MSVFLTSAEAGRALGLSSAWVRVLADRGALPVAAVTRGGIRLFSPDAIEAARVRRGER